MDETTRKEIAPMKTAVIYARYSSERQTEQSIEGQLRECMAYAEQHDMMVVDTYISIPRMWSTTTEQNKMWVLRQIFHVRIGNLPQRNRGALLQMQYPKEGFDQVPQGSHSKGNTGTDHCGRYRQGLG